MSSETHSVEDAGAVPLTLESVEAEANRQRMEAAGKKRVAEKSQAEEQGEKKEKVMAETMRFAIKFEPSAVQFSWYELECQLREILGEARVQQGLEEGTFGVTCLRPDAAEILGAFASRNQAVLTDLGSECERPASAVTFVTMRAHLGGLPLEAKEEEVRQWLREANPSAQFWVKPARQPGAWRVSVTCSVGQPHIPEIFRGKRIVQIAPGEDRPLRADHRLAFIRAAGVEWPQQMQEYLKNHHIVVEVSDIWRSEVAWSSGRWDGTFCVMATPEQREAIDALKRESPDVSLSPGWTECFASEVGPVWCRKYLPISGPLRCLSDRLVRWKILLWDVADAARSLGERMWPLILVGLVKGIIQFQYWTEQMGAPMPASAQNLRRNGQLWTMTGGDARAGQGVNGQTRTPLTPAAVPAGAGEEGAAVLRRRDALGIVTPGVARERVEDNLAKMWQANLTEWYEENPEGDNLKKEENPAVGDNLKKEENPAGQRWATSAGWGMDMMEENPKKGDNLKKEENPGVGDNLKGHRWAPSAGWGTDTEEENPKGDNLKKKKEENPAEGDNLMREGAEENPGFGENLDGRMEDHAGDGNASQAGDIGGILLWLRWLGLASFLLTTPLSFGSALGTGRFGKGDWLGYHGCE
ncbi:hypothetical protein PAPYR_8788 [Paratrimastix pyriformis]|uniref:THUMP domain-containing protein n=1 Tax=Paratrimastix pyriformis TaxID=342808 RepID=A0ABQ8U9W0_9EUKA|nr:hypothetical protein PAPYR_8788 [Paratrimastix pyriformis]